jgi:hypothetical protein
MDTDIDAGRLLTRYTTAIPIDSIDPSTGARRHAPSNHHQHTRRPSKKRYETRYGAAHIHVKRQEQRFSANDNAKLSVISRASPPGSAWTPR